MNTLSVSATWCGDADLDGGVSINEFDLLAGNFGKSLAGPAAAVGSSGLLAFAAHDDPAAFEHVTGGREPATHGLHAASYWADALEAQSERTTAPRRPLAWPFFRTDKRLAPPMNR